MPFECEAHKNAVRQGIIQAITECVGEPPSEETIEKCLKQYEERYDRQKSLRSHKEKIQDIEKYFDMKWGAGRIGVIPEKDPVPTFEHVLEHAKSVFGDLTTKNEQKLKMCYISYFH